MGDSRIGRATRWALPVAGALLLWEVVSRAELVNPRLFPAPSLVLIALRDWLNSGRLLEDLQASASRATLGFLSGGILGLTVGLLTGRSRAFDAVLSPIAQLLRPLPPVAIIPLVIVWLGIGETAKVFSIAFAVFFPVWLNTHLGASRIPTEYLWSAKILRASRIRSLALVVLPATLPQAIAGLRTAIAIAFIMVYVSEIAGASAGIGYRISVSHLAYRIDTMMAALALLAMTGALADYLFASLMRRLFPWLRR